MRARHIPTVMLLLAFNTCVQADPVEFQIDWLGANDYTLSGSFTFDDSLLGTGVINQDDLLSFSISGFFAGSLLGTFDGLPESFLFDARDLFFPVGENSDGSRNTQAWNFIGDSGIGFLSGRFTQSLLLDGEFIDGAGFRVDALTPENSRLVVTRIPEPGTIALLGLGLLGIGAARRRRSTANG